MSNKVIRRILIILLIFICIMNMFFCFLLSFNSIKKVYINENNRTKIQELLAKDFPFEDINNISAIGHQNQLHNSIIYIYNLSNDFRAININDNNNIGRYVQEKGESIDKPLIDVLSTANIIIIVGIVIFEIAIKFNKQNSKIDKTKDNLKESSAIKKFFAVVRTKILFYVFSYELLYAITRILLNQFNLEYMQWVNLVSAIILLVGGIVGTIQLLKKEDISILKIVVLELMIIIIFFVGNYLVFKSLDYEEITYKDGLKMVQNVFSEEYKGRWIEYYDYKNIFIRGKNVRIKDIYDDNFTENEYRCTQYYDENGKYIFSINKYNNQPSTIIIPSDTPNNKQEEEDPKLIKSVEPADILYEREINPKVKIRIINRGAVLGQRILIVIGKTTDGGKTWYNQLEIDDGALTVNNGAKYVFINQNIGFVNNLQTVVNDETQKGLLVTVDGGKTFEVAKFESIEEVENQYLYVEDVPYLENQILKVKTYTLDYNRENTKIYYEFYSKDFGKTWEYSR